MFSCKYWEISKERILKSICVRLLLKILQEEIDQDFLSRESLSKKSRRSNITKIPFAFKPEPLLNLTPTLNFELTFPIFIINGYDRKADACSPWTSCYFPIRRTKLVCYCFSMYFVIYREYGEKWHKDGCFEKKQNVYDDFIFAAEYLIRMNYTSPEK